MYTMMKSVPGGAMPGVREFLIFPLFLNKTKTKSSFTSILSSHFFLVSFENTNFFCSSILEWSPKTFG